MKINVNARIANPQMESLSTRRRGRQNDPDRHTPAGYAAVHPTVQTRLYIEEQLRECKLETDFDMDKLHVTLMYDKANPALFHPGSPLEYEARVVDADLYGDERDTLVLKLASAGLEARFNYLRQAGYRHSYPTYSPHLTIKHPADEKDLALAKEMLGQGFFNEPLVFGGETWEPIVENYYAKD